MTIRILFRVDASHAIGIGHAVRTMTLATEARERGSQVLVVGSGLRKVQKLAESFSALEIVETSVPTPVEDMEYLMAWAPDLVIVDGYHFSREFFELLKKSRIKFGVLDDNAETQANHPAFVLNQNPHSSRGNYPSEWSDTEFFLGMDYLLLRNEIERMIPHAKTKQEEFTLVAIGGTDVLNIASKISYSLTTHGVTAVVPENQVGNRLSGGITHPENTLVSFSLTEYATTLASARIAILGGGSGLYEAICLGIPTIAVIVADNQLNMARELLSQGKIHGLVDFRFGETSDNISELTEVHTRLAKEIPLVASLESRLDLARGKERVAGRILGLIGNL